jgi:6,7-dimethyl-8-ribityllumazine synthase
MIAVVRSRWHSEIVDRGLAGLRDGLRGSPLETATLEVHDVPGALEIPLTAQRLARTGRYAAVVAIALVVDGGIYRHEFVANAVLQGIVDVALATDVPVLSVVLTPQRFHEHAEHQAFFSEHLFTKGREAASALNAMLDPAEPEVLTTL